MQRQARPTFLKPFILFFLLGLVPLIAVASLLSPASKGGGLAQPALFLELDWNPLLIFFSYLYSFNNLILLIYSSNLFLLFILSLRHWRRTNLHGAGNDLASALPSVLVQLPLYNERYVVERLIKAVAELDYSRDRLLIQVLDDSTDDTSSLAKSCVDHYRALGCPIEYRHRTTRSGYKGGALAEGMAGAPGDLIAIFDADFIPPSEFLKQMVPDFQSDPRLGMLQARWEHLNPDQNLITGALALGFDAFFTVEQVARSDAHLFMNFNGSAGIWRRKCIEQAGGWHTDTLVEDTDLSYRAQLLGWRFAYRPDVMVPAQLPDTILALKLQQARWSKGATQTLLKLGRALLASRTSLFSRMEGVLQLSGYFTQPMMLFSLLLSLPVVLLRGQVPLRWAPLGMASVVPPLVSLWSQWHLDRSFFKVWLSYPVLFLSGIGLSISNTQAIVEAFRGRKSEFKRTPKVSTTGPRRHEYRLFPDWTILAELAMSLYGLIVFYLAWNLAPDFAPFILLYAVGFGFTAIVGLAQQA